MLTRFGILRSDKLYSCNLGRYGVCQWLLWQLWSDFFVVMRPLCSVFSEAHMNSGKGVRRSFHPSLHFLGNFYHSPSPSFIIPPLTAPSRLLSTFHVTYHPLSLCPPSSVCLGIFLSLPFTSPYLSTSPSSFAFSPAMPPISSSPCCAPCRSPLLSLSLPSYVSIASSHFLRRHLNCGAANSSGVTPAGVTGLSRSWWMCIRSIFECV